MTHTKPVPNAEPLSRPRTFDDLSAREQVQVLGGIADALPDRDAGVLAGLATVRTSATTSTRIIAIPTRAEGGVHDLEEHVVVPGDGTGSVLLRSTETELWESPNPAAVRRIDTGAGLVLDPSVRTALQRAVGEIAVDYAAARIHADDGLVHLLYVQKGMGGARSCYLLITR